MYELLTFSHSLYQQVLCICHHMSNVYLVSKWYKIIVSSSYDGSWVFTQITQSFNVARSMFWPSIALWQFPYFSCMCLKFGLFISCSLTELAVLEARENLIKYLPVWVSKRLNAFKDNHFDQDASKEPMNPLQARIHCWSLWSTMIWVILDHSVQRKLCPIAQG